MTDRIDKYLDGALDHAALTPAEQAQADTVGRVIEHTRTFVAARPVPDFSDRVLRQIQTQRLRPAAPRPQDVLQRLLEHVWTPRQVSFRIRPAYAMVAAAALIVLVLSLPGSLRSRTDTAPLVAEAVQPQLLVQFRLQAAEASDVRLAGSFTNWEPQYRLHEAAPGVWTITVPLPPGVHDYLFVVDGQQWVPDPEAQHVSDGFGGINSRIAILSSEAQQS
ncbi:MAG: hypothetical protein HYY76_02785 [Acidobacteria bacterium]|nr:hypothetical protein [Acidobacteriota bacterium]